MMYTLWENLASILLVSQVCISWYMQQIGWVSIVLNGLMNNFQEVIVPAGQIARSTEVNVTSSVHKLEDLV